MCNPSYPFLEDKKESSTHELFINAILHTTLQFRSGIRFRNYMENRESFFFPGVK